MLSDSKLEDSCSQKYRSLNISRYKNFIYFEYYIKKNLKIEKCLDYLSLIILTAIKYI